MPSWVGVFLFDTFLSLALCELRCIFDFGSSSSPNAFYTLLVHLAFLLFSLSCHILLKNCFVSLSSSCWCAFVDSLPNCRYIFSYFGISCFVRIFYPISFLSSFFRKYILLFFPRVVLFLIVEFLFYSAQHVAAFALCLIFFVCRNGFLICVFSRIFHPGFEFQFVLVGDTDFITD